LISFTVAKVATQCSKLTYQIERLSKVMNQAFANQTIILIVTCIVPVVQEGAKHGTRLPPIVWRIQYARITSQDARALIVDDGILRNELFGDF
jgi:hypothetical protein